MKTMNGTIRNQLGHIKCAVELLQQVLGVDAKEVFRFAYTHLYAPAQACGHARERVCARDINNNINILTKSAYVKGESMRGGEGKVADATARAPGFSLGFVLRNKPSAIPEYFAIWWYKSMKDRDWALAKGGHVTAANFRVHLCTWYKHVDVNETQEAHELYDKWKGIFRAQEMFAAEEWGKCRGCDHFAKGHCLACALKPIGAEACRKFAPRRDKRKEADMKS